MKLFPYQEAILRAIEQRDQPRPVRPMPMPKPVRGKSGVVIIDEFFR